VTPALFRSEICDAFLRRRQLCPIPCKCRLERDWRPRPPRRTLLSPGAQSPIGTRRQYCASAVGRDAGSFNDAGNVINIGIGFEITVEEMIEYLHRAIMNSVRPVVAAVASL
jgi:hypothetical protein